MLEFFGPEGGNGVHRPAGDGGTREHFEQDIDGAKRRAGGEAKRGKPQLPLVERRNRPARRDDEQDQSPKQRRLGQAGAWIGRPEPR